MPDRVVRDELLESERWLTLKGNDDRLAFLALLLRADAFGNFIAAPYRLLRMWRDFGIDTTELVAKTLSELVEKDLIRLYDHDGQRYLHIPRFQQRLRYTKRVFPQSPWDVKQTVTQHSPDSHQALTSPSPDSHTRSEVKGSEGKKQTNPPAPASLGSALAAVVKDLPPGFEAFWNAYPNTRKVARMECLKRWQTRGLEKISDRILAHLTLMKATKAWQEGFDPAPLTYINQRRWEDGQTQPAAEQRRVAL